MLKIKNAKEIIMKKIEAIVQPQKFEAVKDALVKEGITRMTVLEAEGYGRQEGKTEIFRGQEYEVNLLPKVYIMIIVNDDFLDKAVDAIIKSAKTGTIGDGKIFVSDIKEVIRIRTEEKGKDAL